MVLPIPDKDNKRPPIAEMRKEKNRLAFGERKLDKKAIVRAAIISAVWLTRTFVYMLPGIYFM